MSQRKSKGDNTPSSSTELAVGECVTTTAKIEEGEFKSEVCRVGTNRYEAQGWLDGAKIIDLSWKKGKKRQKPKKYGRGRRGR